MAILSLTEAELRTRRSMKWRTYPEDILPLWVAEMDVRMHPAVRRTLVEAADRGDTGYPFGRAYAQAFASMAEHRWGWQIDEARQIKIAGDVMNAILAVLEATTDPGDAVVINPPVYPPFRQVISGYRRRIVEAPLAPEGRLDPAALEAALAGPERPRAYLLCSPHNPTGAVHTPAELAVVVELANRYEVTLIVDEIHAPLVDPGVAFTPVLTVPGSERAVAVTSAGKAWNLAAFKAGLIIGGPGASGTLANLPPLATQSTGHMGSMVHTAAMTEAQDWIDELVGEVSANKQLLRRLLSEFVPGAHYSPAEGTYLAWVDCSDLGLADPAASFRELGRVAFSPGAVFGREHSHWVRINLATSPPIVTDAVRRMAATVTKS